MHSNIDIDKREERERVRESLRMMIKIGTGFGLYLSIQHNGSVLYVFF